MCKKLNSWKVGKSNKSKIWGNILDTFNKYEGGVWAAIAWSEGTINQ